MGMHVSQRCGGMLSKFACTAMAPLQASTGLYRAATKIAQTRIWCHITPSNCVPYSTMWLDGLYSLLGLNQAE